MLIRPIVTFLGLILLISSFNMSAYAFFSSGQKPEALLGIENEIAKVFLSNGLDPSDITIMWNQTSTGGYLASIRCLNSAKCNKSEVTLSFTKQEIERLNTSTLQNQLLKTRLNSLLNSNPR